MHIPRFYRLYAIAIALCLAPILAPVEARNAVREAPKPSAPVKQTVPPPPPPPAPKPDVPAQGPLSASDKAITSAQEKSGDAKEAKAAGPGVTPTPAAVPASAVDDTARKKAAEAANLPLKMRTAYLQSLRQSKARQASVQSQVRIPPPSAVSDNGGGGFGGTSSSGGASSSSGFGGSRSSGGASGSSALNTGASLSPVPANMNTAVPSSSSSIPPNNPPPPSPVNARSSLAEAPSLPDLFGSLNNLLPPLVSEGSLDPKASTPAPPAQISVPPAPSTLPSPQPAPAPRTPLAAVTASNPFVRTPERASSFTSQPLSSVGGQRLSNPSPAVSFTPRAAGVATTGLKTPETRALSPPSVTAPSTAKEVQEAADEDEEDLPVAAAKETSDASSATEAVEEKSDTLPVTPVSSVGIPIKNAATETSASPPLADSSIIKANDLSAAALPNTIKEKADGEAKKTNDTKKVVKGVDHKGPSVAASSELNDLAGPSPPLKESLAGQQLLSDLSDLVPLAAIERKPATTDKVTSNSTAPKLDTPTNRTSPKPTSPQSDARVVTTTKETSKPFGGNADKLSRTTPEEMKKTEPAALKVNKLRSAPEADSKKGSLLLTYTMVGKTGDQPASLTIIPPRVPTTPSKKESSGMVQPVMINSTVAQYIAKMEPPQKACVSAGWKKSSESERIAICQDVKTVQEAFHFKQDILPGLVDACSTNSKPRDCIFHVSRVCAYIPPALLNGKSAADCIREGAISACQSFLPSGCDPSINPSMDWSKSMACTQVMNKAKYGALADWNTCRDHFDSLYKGRLAECKPPTNATCLQNAIRVHDQDVAQFISPTVKA